MSNTRIQSDSDPRFSAWELDTSVSSKGVYKLKKEEIGKAISTSQKAHEVLDLLHRNLDVASVDLYAVQREFKNKFKHVKVIGGLLNAVYRAWNMKLGHKLDTSLNKLRQENIDRHNALMKGSYVNHVLSNIPAYRSLSEPMKQTVHLFLSMVSQEKRNALLENLFQGNFNPILQEISSYTALVERFPDIIASGAMPQGEFSTKVPEWSEKKFLETFVTSYSCTKENFVAAARYIHTLLHNKADEKAIFTALSAIGPKRAIIEAVKSTYEKKIQEQKDELDTLLKNLEIQEKSLQSAGENELKGSSSDLEKLDQEINEKQKEMSTQKGVLDAIALFERYSAILEAKARLLSKSITPQSSHEALHNILCPQEIQKTFIENKETVSPFFLSSLGIPSETSPTFGFFEKEKVRFIRMQVPCELQNNVTYSDLKVEGESLIPLDERSIVSRLTAAYHLARHGSVSEARKMLDMTFATKMLSDNELMLLKVLYRENKSLQKHIQQFFQKASLYHTDQSSLYNECEALFLKNQQDKKVSRSIDAKPHVTKKIRGAPEIHKKPKDLQNQVKGENKKLFDSLSMILQPPVENVDEAKPQVQEEYRAFMEEAHSILTEPSSLHRGNQIPQEYQIFTEAVDVAKFDNLEPLTNAETGKELSHFIEQQEAKTREVEMKLSLLVASHLPKGRSFDIQELMVLHAQNRLDRLFPEENTLKKVKSVLIEYLSQKQEFQKSKRLLESFLKLPQASTQAEFEKQKSDFIAAAQATRVYEAGKYPRFQVFEVFADVMIRKEQFESLKTLSDSSKSVILQLLMGSGKTFLLLPLLGMLRADGNNISTVMLPEALLPNVLGQLKATLGRGFNQLISELPLPQGREITQQDLERIEAVLDTVQDERGCLLVSPNKKHILLNTFTLFLDEYHARKSPEIEIKVVSLARILARLDENESVIGDEVDDLLKTQLQYIIPLGKPVQYDTANSKLVSELVLKAVEIARKKEIALDFDPVALDSTKKKKYTVEMYHKLMKEDLAHSALQMLQNPKDIGTKEAEEWQEICNAHYENLRLYLTLQEKNEINRSVADACMESISKLPPAKRERLAELRFTLVNVLPNGFYSECNKEYGVIESQVELIARPFAAAKTPTETQFSNPVEQVSRTIQAYLKLGVPLEALKEIQKSHLEQYNRIFGSSVQPEQAQEKLRDIETLREFIQTFLFPVIQVHPEQISSTPQKLFDSSKTFSGITGTFWNVSSMPGFDLTQSDTKTEVKMLLQFLRKEQMEADSSSKISVTNVKEGNANTLLEKITKNSKKPLALIDSGGWLSDIETMEFAQKVLGSREDLKAVVFHNEKGEIVVLKRGEKAPTLFTKDQEKEIQPSERFTIYQQNFTVGTDIYQVDTAQAIMSVGKKMILRDFEQAIFRMRKILETQGCELMVDEEAAETIQAKLGPIDLKSITLTTLYRFFITNQVVRRLGENYSASHQRIENTLEMGLRRAIFSALLKESPNFDLVEDIWKEGRKFFVSEQVQAKEEDKASEEIPHEDVEKKNVPTAWSKYGHIPKRISRDDKIEAEVKQYESSFKQLAKIPEVKVSLGLSLHDSGDAEKALRNLIANCYPKGELEENLLDNDAGRFVGQMQQVQKTTALKKSEGVVQSNLQNEAKGKVQEVSFREKLIATDEVRENLLQIDSLVRDARKILEDSATEIGSKSETYKVWAKLYDEHESLQKQFKELSQQAITVESRFRTSILLAKAQRLYKNIETLPELGKLENRVAHWQEKMPSIGIDLLQNLHIDLPMITLMRQSLERMSEWLQEESTHFNPENGILLPFLSRMKQEEEKCTHLYQDFSVQILKEGELLKHRMREALQQLDKITSPSPDILQVKERFQNLLQKENGNIIENSQVLQQVQDDFLKLSEERFKEVIQPQAKRVEEYIGRLEEHYKVLVSSEKTQKQAKKYEEMIHHDSKILAGLQSLQTMSEKEQKAFLENVSFSIYYETIEESQRYVKAALRENTVVHMCNVQIEAIQKKVEQDFQGLKSNTIQNQKKQYDELLHAVEERKKAILTKDLFDPENHQEFVQKVTGIITSTTSIEFLQFMMREEMQFADFLSDIQERITLLTKRKEILEDVSRLEVTPGYQKKVQELKEKASKATLSEIYAIIHEAREVKQNLIQLNLMLQESESMKMALSTCSIGHKKTLQNIQTNIAKLQSNISSHEGSHLENLALLFQSVKEDVKDFVLLQSVCMKADTLLKENQGLKQFKNVPLLATVNMTSLALQEIESIRGSVDTKEDVKKATKQLQEKISHFEMSSEFRKKSVEQEVGMAKKTLTSLKQGIAVSKNSAYSQEAKELSQKLQSLIEMKVDSKKAKAFINGLQECYESSVALKAKIDQERLELNMKQDLARGLRVEEGFTIFEKARQQFNTSIQQEKLESLQNETHLFTEKRQELVQVEHKASAFLRVFDEHKRRIEEEKQHLSQGEKILAADALLKLEAHEKKLEHMLTAMKSVSSLEQAQKKLQEAVEFSENVFQKQFDVVIIAINASKQVFEKLENKEKSLEECRALADQLLDLDDKGIVSLQTLMLSRGSPVARLLAEYMFSMVRDFGFLDEALSIADMAFSSNEEGLEEIQTLLVKTYQDTILVELEKECASELEEFSVDGSVSEFEEMQETFREKLSELAEEKMERFSQKLVDSGIPLESSMAQSLMAHYALEVNDIITSIQGRFAFEVISVFQEDLESLSYSEVEELKAFVDVQVNLFETVNQVDNKSQFRRYQAMSRDMSKRLKEVSQTLQNHLSEASTFSKVCRVGKRIFYQGSLAMMGGVLITTCPFASPIGGLLIGMAYQDAAKMISDPLVDHATQKLPKWMQPYAKTLMQTGISLATNQVYARYQNEIIGTVTGVAGTVTSVALNAIKGVQTSSQIELNDKEVVRLDEQTVEQKDSEVEEVKAVEQKNQEEPLQEQHVQQEHEKDIQIEKIYPEVQELKDETPSQVEENVAKPLEDTTQNVDKVEKSVQVENIPQNVVETSNVQHEEFIPEEIDISQLPIHNLYNGDLEAFKLYALEGKFANTKFVDKASGRVFASFWDALETAQNQAQSVVSEKTQVLTEEAPSSAWEVFKKGMWVGANVLAKVGDPMGGHIESAYTGKSNQDNNRIDRALGDFFDTLNRFKW